MLSTLAVANYRSIIDLKIPLRSLNVVTGPNGSGKSNVYRALRLLADTASGGVTQSLAIEGGLPSTFWAGPANISARMKSGEVAVQGTHRNDKPRLRLGFADDTFGYSISLGLPEQTSSAFSLDPEIKREVIWAGPSYRPAASLVDRKGPAIKLREGRRWNVIDGHAPAFESIFTRVADAERSPEISRIKQVIGAWRFYDHFRTDMAAPARSAQLGTRTPVLSNDGRDLAAALQTIREIGDVDGLDAAIDDAFPGASLTINVQDDNRFAIAFRQHGLLRPLSGAELSDGTLRYLLWIAALMTPRPPPLMVLNEPETSLHPDLLPALGRLIIQASEHSQVWVVSHASRLINALQESEFCNSIQLEKTLGETEIVGQEMFDEPSWKWPD